MWHFAVLLKGQKWPRMHRKRLFGTVYPASPKIIRSDKQIIIKVFCGLEKLIEETHWKL